MNAAVAISRAGAASGAGAGVWVSCSTAGSATCSTACSTTGTVTGSPAGAEAGRKGEHCINETKIHKRYESDGQKVAKSESQDQTPRQETNYSSRNKQSATGNGQRLDLAATKDETTYLRSPAGRITGQSAFIQLRLAACPATKNKSRESGYVFLSQIVRVRPPEGSRAEGRV